MRASIPIFSVGVVFLLLSFAAPMVNFNPFATVIIDDQPPQFITMWPGMTTSSTYPQNLGTPGSTVELFFTVDEQLSTARVDIKYPSDFTFTFGMDYAGQTSGGNWKYNVQWVIPEIPGVYSFKYTAEDMAGNVAVRTVYGQPTGTIDGYFTINGKQVDKDSVIRLASRQVTFAFYATSGAASITDIEVRIYVGAPAYGLPIDTVTLKSVEGLGVAPPGVRDSWTAAYTFPSSGTYTVQGVVNPGANVFMDVAVNLGGFEIPEVNFVFLGLAVACFAAGAIIRTREEES